MSLTVQLDISHLFPHSSNSSISSSSVYRKDTVFVYTLVNIKTVLYLKIKFSIITPFSSIWPIDWTLSVATTPGQGWPVSIGNKGIICIPQSSSITEASPSDCLMSYPGHSLGEFYPSAVMQSGYSTAPTDWAKYFWIQVKLNRVPWFLNSQYMFFSLGANIIHIYQPLRSGRIWHKVNFLSGV